jgi:hypothetical protein
LIGLPVNTQMPEEIFRVIALYPPARQGEPSVSYLPGPRYRKVEPGGAQEAQMR